MSSLRFHILGGPQLAAALKQRQEGVKKAMAISVGLGAQLVYGRVVRKLTGPVLKVQSGRLRQSVVSLVEGVFTDNPKGIVGTNVEYAPVHEYGLTIQHPGSVAADRPSTRNPNARHTLRFEIGGKVFYRIRTRAHPIKMPERPFMRPSLAESVPQIRNIMVTRLARALKGAV